MSFFPWQRLTQEQRRLWKIGGGIIVAGTAFKFLYFNFSRGLLLENMDRTHVEAKQSLTNAKKFAQWADEDRSKRLPKLTDEQRKQLKEYLDLVAEKQFDDKRTR
mmetsp:Transcript_24152/g.34584  ORF Transcript_24152/g.34584 Transcript_24152/m.34584 type:complete len:105 (-) Transcript_24152:1338-1652(-)